MEQVSFESIIYVDEAQDLNKYTMEEIVRALGSDQFAVNGRLARVYLPDQDYMRLCVELGIDDSAGYGISIMRPEGAIPVRPRTTISDYLFAAADAGREPGPENCMEKENKTEESKTFHGYLDPEPGGLIHLVLSDLFPIREIVRADPNISDDVRFLFQAECGKWSHLTITGHALSSTTRWSKYGLQKTLKTEIKRLRDEHLDCCLKPSGYDDGSTISSHIAHVDHETPGDIDVTSEYLVIKDELVNTRRKLLEQSLESLLCGIGKRDRFKGLYTPRYCKTCGSDYGCMHPRLEDE